MSETIPNIINFIYFKEEQTTLIFVHYLAVYSAYIINKPNKINFYHNGMITGAQWEKLEEIPCLEKIKIDVPTHIGIKPLKKNAHKADILRMNLLYNNGGIYFDIDTISVNPYTHLLDSKNDVIMCYEKKEKLYLCNAILFTKAKSKFFELWLKQYETHFLSDGWGESSIVLPGKIAKQNPSLITIREQAEFFWPSWKETDKIFAEAINIPDNLITLHLWERYSRKYINSINDWKWAHANKHTLYGKIMLKILDIAYPNKYSIAQNNKCSRVDCLYLIHSNKDNNNGLYCCKSCKNGINSHGRLCEKKPLLK